MSPTKPGAPAAPEEDPDESEEEETFDPRAPRSNFSLFPLENLLYCEDCKQIRCPRCVHDEIVCFFCPNCLFEVPSSTVKTDGNRCTRNCFSCPICFASLVVAPTGGGQAGPYILLCNHCLWSSAEMGIEFEKPTSIAAQLAEKLKPPALAKVTSGSFTSPLSPLSASSEGYFPSMGAPTIITPDDEEDKRELSPEERFIKLKAHYAQQKTGAGADEYGGSPGALSRLMGLYSGLGSGSRSRSFGRGIGGFSNMGGKGKLEWAEWDAVKEIGDDGEELVEKIREAGFSRTTSKEQRIAQNHQPRFIQDLKPLAALLRTKRSKRCRACRHILVKPESKPTTIRFRIKLVAMNYIPALSISRLDPTAFNYAALTPLSTHQFLLTITNPLFDPINVTLATPAKTPGSYPSTVTILCPTFEVGANTDVWDEALQTTANPPTTAIKKGRKTGMLIGTVWDLGRNWTTVVIEIVPPLLPLPGELDEDGNELATEDDRLVQVPVSVRVVYETDLERDDGGLGKEAKEKREHTYWSVLGLGRISEKMPTTATEDAAGPSAARPMSLASIAGKGVTGRGGAVEEISGSKVNRHSVR
ncbi:unnamed protein product [Tuber melanosporum]|uniref:Dynactin subunit 4 n=1 Tax=Tuber melanosporum (strain Mel28) TaxID=656061 RepID=D5GIA5_TUBMM|nr:uncharacterized protein GSTUM_00008367001 [Tuber melanosporum]CAZ84248.1 unnamed protein product [Tuber melanosporum]